MSAIYPIVKYFPPLAVYNSVELPFSQTSMPSLEVYVKIGQPIKRIKLEKKRWGENADFTSILISRILAHPFSIPNEESICGIPTRIESPIGRGKRVTHCGREI